MSGIMILVRGLPGSGKTTFARKLRALIGNRGNAFEICADECDDRLYQEDGFHPEFLSSAHERCQTYTEKHILEDRDLRNMDSVIIVHNTFTTEKEMQPYIALAERYDLLLFTVIVENRHGNKSVHNVPDAGMKRMKDRFNIQL